MKDDDAARGSPAAPGNAPGDEDIGEVPVFRKKRIVIPLLVLLLGGIAAGGYWYVDLRSYVSTDDAYVDANRVSISTKVLGRVAELTVDEGDSVKRGQLLVRLDDSDARAQERQSEASLSLAEVSVGLSQSNLEKADDDYQRAKTQYAGGVVTKEQFDHAEKALGAARAEHRIALARVESAKAQLMVARTSLENTLVTSPIDGVVAKRWILRGDVAQPGQPIYSIYDLGNLWVTANFEETKLGSIHPGEAVEVSVDAYPDAAFTGSVFQIGSYTASEFSLIPPNNASGNFTKVTQRVPVKISIRRADSTGGRVLPLLPGMSVEVRIRDR
jgi:membrane fusion protein (multidrug efflux system)